MATFDQFVSSIRQEFGEQDAGKKSRSSANGSLGMILSGQRRLIRSGAGVNKMKNVPEALRSL